MSRYIFPKSEYFVFNMQMMSLVGVSRVCNCPASYASLPSPLIAKDYMLNGSTGRRVPMLSPSKSYRVSLYEFRALEGDWR